MGKKMKKPKPKKVARVKRFSVPPRQMKTDDLCKSLVCIAALQIENRPTQMKIYEAVRRLQVLDQVAIKAGILLP